MEMKSRKSLQESFHSLLEVIQLVDLLGQGSQFLLEETEGDFPQFLAILVQPEHGIVDGIVGEGSGPGQRTIAALQRVRHDLATNRRAMLTLISAREQRKLLSNYG